jgi:hypothetical protein
MSKIWKETVGNQTFQDIYLSWGQSFCQKIHIQRNVSIAKKLDI